MIKKMKNVRKTKIGAAVIAVAAVVFMLAGCASGHTGNPKSAVSAQNNGQAVTGAYEAKLMQAEPYPLSEMNDSAELSNLKERLLVLNNPNQLGYVYLLNYQGQVYASYVIKGKVSSTASEMTPTQTVQWGGCYNGCSSAVYDSPSDDGSYGPEEGGTNGIFFFTASGHVLVEASPTAWIYSNAPQHTSNPATITVPVSSKGVTIPIPKGSK